MNIQEVTGNHICTGCGTCYGICPTDAIKMTETIDGRLSPYIINSNCTDCGLCRQVCPQIQKSKRISEVIKESLAGHIQKGYLGRPSDKSLYMKGQTCGFVRCLLMYALESGYADRIICVRDDPENPLHPVVDVFSEIKHVRDVSRSKYCPINFGQAVKLIGQSEGNYIVVGLGCQIQGLNNVMERIPLIRNRVKLVIGLFCDRILKYGASDFLVQRSGVNQESVQSFDFRHKKWRGYPGDIRVIDKEGMVHNVERKWRLRIVDFYTPVGCRLCIDKLNMLSDISVGDPWGIRPLNKVSSVIVSRTSKGDQFLSQAKQLNKIELEKCDIQNIVQGQNIDKKIQNCIAFKAIMQKRGLEIPVILNEDVLADKKASAGLVNSLFFYFNLLSENQRGAGFLGHLPLWLVLVLSYFKTMITFNHRARNFLKRLIIKSVR